MADSNKDIRDTNDLLREQLELLKQVKDLHQDSYDVSTAAVDSIKEALGINSRRSTFERDTLKVNQSIAQAILDQKTGLSDMESIGRQISKNQDLLNKAKLIEAGLSSNVGSKDQKKIDNFTKLYKEQQLLNQQLERGEDLTKRQINSLLKKLALNDAQLDSYTQQLNSQQLQLAYTKLNTEELKKQQSLRENELGIQQKLEDQLGLVGKIAKTFGHFKGISEDVTQALSDTTKEMQRMATEGGKVIGKWQSFGMFMGNLGKNLTKHLTDPLAVLTSFVSVLKNIDSGAGEYAKSMNVTYSEALNVRGEMQSIAASSGDVALNSSRLQETLMAVGKEMGSNAKLNEADLITFTKLREQAGYTNEELMGIQKLSLVNNKTLEANTKEILGAAAAYNGKNKLALNEKQILKDVNSASSALKLSLGGSVTQLTNAAAKAREFGLSLEQTEKIAESLLNFESSIESELSAELLTGRNLNLEQARLLALNGQTAEAATEIAKQVGTSADFARMNVIQQEAIAKAAGMTRNELADSLIDKESLAKLNVKDAKSAQDAYNQLKASGMSEMEIQKRLGDKKLADQYEQQSAQDRFNQSVEKLKEIFVSLAGPILQILSPIAEMVGWISKFDTLIKSAAVSFATIKTIMIASELLQKRSLLLRAQDLIISAQIKANEIATAVAKMTGSGAVSLGITAAIGLAAGAAAYAYFNSISATPVGDFGYSNKTGETTISTKEGGLYAISDNDEIAVAPRINTRLSTPQTQQTTQTNHMETMVNKIEHMFDKLGHMFAKHQDRPVVVHSEIKVDGEKIATASNNSNRKNSFAIS